MKSNALAKAVVYTANGAMMGTIATAVAKTTQLVLPSDTKPKKAAKWMITGLATGFSVAVAQELVWKSTADMLRRANVSLAKKVSPRA